MAEETPEPTEEISIPEDLEEIKGELTGIFHGQGQRVTEFRVVVSQGLRKIQEDLQILMNAGRELSRRNAEILQDAAESSAAADRFESMQGEIEAQLDELKRINKDLGDECEHLASEREDQTRARKETTEGNELIREDIHKITQELDRVEIDNDVVRKELKSLKRKNNTLQKEVDALQQRRQEYLTEISKYKEMKAGLVS